jgi:hypothetical protein
VQLHVFLNALSLSPCGSRRTWNSRSRFKNVKVTAPDSKVLPEGLPDLEAAGASK